MEQVNVGELGELGTSPLLWDSMKAAHVPDHLKVIAHTKVQ